MARKRLATSIIWSALLVGLLAIGCAGPAAGQEEQKNAAPEVKADKPQHVPEVEALLKGLTVDKPRTYKNMLVFPIRWAGKQAEGKWATLDEAVAADELKISEKPRASVPEVQMENSGDKTILLMSGEIIKGGKQTRVVRQDTVIEAKQTVAVAVFCVEQHRWQGDVKFKNSSNMAPAAVQETIKRDGDQGAVWRRVRQTAEKTGASSPTESLDEVLDSREVQTEHDAARKSLGKFSPPETVGIAVADVRSGRVVGLELFGCRYLFAQLQEKLIEGYTTDVVMGNQEWNPKDAKEITEKDVEKFIQLALDGRSKYEDTPGSGRGIDLVSGTMRGKGVALGEQAIHLSIQDLRPDITPARPIVDPSRPPLRQPMPEPLLPND